MKDIESYIHSYFGIGHKDVSKISDFFKENHIAKGDFLLKTGGQNTQLSFLKSGYIRFFASSPNGEKEITQWIATPGTFVTDLSCLIFDAPAKWNIQTLSDCELYTISEANYKQIGDHIPNWPHLEKLFISKCFNTLEDRIFSHLSMSSEERYNMFFQFNPEMFNQVPLHFIASMLGMTPETLSRIRKKQSS